MYVKTINIFGKEFNDYTIIDGKTTINLGKIPARYGAYGMREDEEGKYINAPYDEEEEEYKEYVKSKEYKKSEDYKDLKRRRKFWETPSTWNDLLKLNSCWWDGEFKNMNSLISGEMYETIFSDIEKGQVEKNSSLNLLVKFNKKGLFTFDGQPGFIRRLEGKRQNKLIKDLNKKIITTNKFLISEGINTQIGEVFARFEIQKPYIFFVTDKKRAEKFAKIADQYILENNIEDIIFYSVNKSCKTLHFNPKFSNLVDPITKLELCSIQPEVTLVKNLTKGGVVFYQREHNLFRSPNYLEVKREFTMVKKFNPKAYKDVSKQELSMIRLFCFNMNQEYYVKILNEILNKMEDI